MQLALTEQLFDAVLGELSVVARGQPCLLVGDFNVPTCKRCWTAAGGRRRDFILGCPLAAAAFLFCKVQPDRWIAPHLAVRALFDCGRWEYWVTQLVQCTPLWPASWLPAVDKGRSSKSAEVQRVWKVYDERLQFMSRRDASLLDESLGLDDVFMAWAVWSRAAEAAFADALPVSVVVLFLLEVLVLGRGSCLCFVLSSAWGSSGS